MQNIPSAGGQIMQKHPEITLNRLQSFKARFLQKKLYGEAKDVGLSVYEAPGRSRPFYDAVTAEDNLKNFSPAKIGGTQYNLIGLWIPPPQKNNNMFFQSMF